MAKTKTVYVCSSCGHSEPKWLGRCPDCGEWNSFTESSPKGKDSGSSRGPAHSIPIQSIESKDTQRFDTGIREINRVLGGGIMKGGSILIGGEPGIGKSTLMLQIAGSIRTAGRVLYISGEESPEQLKQRAQRLGIKNDQLEVLSETELDSVLWVIESVKPVIIIVDSVQTLHSPELGAVPGTVNQIKYCSQEIISWVRERLCAVFFVAHVTKEGFIAGPKVMEHMVDTVIYFDRSDSDVRFLRPTKNRFGAVDEIGLFTMQTKGLIEVLDPSSLFMIHREEAVPAGLSVAAVYEGSRILLVELQALTVPAKSSISRVFSDRIDSARVSRIAAVMEKHVGLRFSDQDIYVNVAGGIRLTEVGIDLPLAMALYSARSDIPIPVKTAMAGEVSLAGEIRPIPHLKRRVKAAADIGFGSFVSPEETAREDGTEQSSRHKIRTVKSVKEAIRALFS